MDLRVEDHEDPVEELARLVRLRTAYLALRVFPDDPDFRERTLAALRLAPEQAQVRISAGMMHARAGEWEEALPLLRSAFDEEPRWSEALRRLAAAGRISPELVSEMESKLG